MYLHVSNLILFDGKDDCRKSLVRLARGGSRAANQNKCTRILTSEKVILNNFKIVKKGAGLAQIRQFSDTF